MFMLGSDHSQAIRYKDEIMPRTAGTIDGTPLYKIVSLKMIDSTGDKRTDSYQFPAAVTNAQIETFVAALAADINANIYDVRVQDAYSSIPDTGDALNDLRPSLLSNIVVLVKTPLNESDDLYIPAPMDDNFIPTTDDPIVGELSATMAAFLACKNAGGGAFEVVSGRYTERREINKSVPF